MYNICNVMYNIYNLMDNAKLETDAKIMQSQILPDTARCCQIFPDTARYCKVFPGTARYCLILQHTPRYNQIQPQISSDTIPRLAQIQPNTSSSILKLPEILQKQTHFKPSCHQTRQPDPPPVTKPYQDCSQKKKPPGLQPQTPPLAKP